MFQETDITLRRLARVRRDLIDPNRYSPAVPFQVSHWAVPSESDGTAGAPVSPEIAVAAEFEPITQGTPWGAPWATTWFRFSVVIPESFADRAVDAVLDIGFSLWGPGFQAEGLIWKREGSGQPDSPHRDSGSSAPVHSNEGRWVPYRGLHPMNHVVRISDSATAGETVEILVEAASNPTLVILREDPNSDLPTASTTPIYRLGACDLAVANDELIALDRDFACAVGWARELPMDQPRANELLRAIEDALGALDPLDPAGSANLARAALAPALSSPAHPASHQIYAVGHAHIDSAWLWPIRETIRKCARTFSNVLRLMDDNPELRFGCSQAVQYDWMREHCPSIFEGIRAAVERGQWIPIGGQWVEADGNITGGESHIRQLLHGQRFFREHFGITCHEVWIPDVFGYPASLPQLFRLGGAERFLTQKLSWNRTNRFPHHYFWWEGIDGSRVYTHFPPVDTYNATFSPAELAFSITNFKDHGQASLSLMPFGHGDGGGGPTVEMLEAFERSRDLQGSPRIRMASPAEFFDDAMAEYPDPPTWVGELYFEMHRGTYTSQARTKLGNRRAEVALREAELWCTMAFGGRAADGYPIAELDDLWKTVLLHQFHDILPGTSIGWVHREAEATYADVLRRLDSVIERALKTLAGRLSARRDTSDGHDAVGRSAMGGSAVAGQNAVGGPSVTVVANAAPFDRDEITLFDSTLMTNWPECTQLLADGRVAARLSVPAQAFAMLEQLPLNPHPSAPHLAGPRPAELPKSGQLEPVEAAPFKPVQTSRRDGDGWVINNGIISVSFDDSGCLVSLVELASNRELLASGKSGGEWHLHHDMPLEYDAWDIEEYYRDRVNVIDGVDSVEVLDSGPLVTRLRVRRRFRSSSICEVFELRAGSPRLDIHVELDWHERNHLLKVAWPLDLAATEVVRDIQYGHISTPIHRNTTWDTARFEISAHRWIDIDEGDFGVAMLNNGRYGHDLIRTRGPMGEATTTMSLTVAKGAIYPDPHADEGLHEFTYSIMPHSGSLATASLSNPRLDVISQGYSLNMPMRALPLEAGSSTGTTSEAFDSTPARPLPIVRSSDPSVIVEVIKAAEDGSGDLIIRVWESLGNRVTSQLSFAEPFFTARLTDALEDGAPPSPAPLLSQEDDHRVNISLRPFQIATIRVVKNTPHDEVAK